MLIATGQADFSVPQLGRIQVPKASDLLATRLRERVLSGFYTEGDLLPNERDLATETGLGRSSVREALRILENQGLIETRVGRNGGSVVQRPRRASVENSISLFIRGQKLRMEALLEAREGVEPAAARFAAIHRTDADLDRLIAKQAGLEEAERAQDIPRFLVGNVEWHLAVALASHNELLIAFMSAISQAIHAATDIENFNKDEARAATLRIHARVNEAIRAGDPDAAERRMRRHVHAYVERIHERTREGADRTGHEDAR